MKKYHQIFGFPEQNTLKTVKRIFNKKIKIVHPDKANYSPETCKIKTQTLINQYESIKQEIQDLNDLEKYEQRIEKIKKWWKNEQNKKKFKTLQTSQQQPKIQKQRQQDLNENVFKPNLNIIKGIKKEKRTKDKNIIQWNEMFKKINNF